MFRQVIDAMYRCGLRIAYRMLRAWWFIRRPYHEGVLVGVWQGPRVLLVRTSYHGWFGLAGGSRRRNESPQEAAVRELAEELGMYVDPDQLSYRCSIEHSTEHRRENLPFFEVELSQDVAVHIDNREIVWAEFVTVDEALQLNLFPPVRQYLQQRAAKA